MYLPTIRNLLRSPLFCYYLINYSLTFPFVCVYIFSYYLKHINQSHTFCLYSYLAFSFVITNLLRVHNNHNNYSLACTTLIYMSLLTQKQTDDIHSTLKYTTKKRFQNRYKSEENHSTYLLTRTQPDDTSFLSINEFNG